MTKTPARAESVDVMEGLAMATTVLTLNEFEAIFQAHSPYVWHSLRRLGVYESDLEDVAHEVFIMLHKKMADYDRARPIRPWIFGFAFRYAARYRALARHRREVKTDDVEYAYADDRAPADELLDDHQRRQLLQAALATIDFDQRAVFIMADMDGISISEIAETLKLSPNTVYSRRRLAREALMAALKRLKMKRGFE